MSQRSLDFVLLLLLFISPVFGASRPASPDLEDAKQLAVRYYDAYRTKDLNALAATWSSQSPYWKSRKSAVEQFFAEQPSIDVAKVNVGKPYADGDQIKVPVSLRLKLKKEETRTSPIFDSPRRLLRLVREPGGWKIWNESSEEEPLAEALYAAKTDEERRTLLASNAHLVNGELVRSIVRVTDSDRRKGNYGMLPLYELAQEIAVQKRDRAAEAFALSAIGSISFGQSNFREALRMYERALVLRDGIQSRSGSASSLNNIALVHRIVGDYDRSLAVSERALKIGEELAEPEIISAALNHIGVVQRRLGNYAAALVSLERSLTIRKQVGDQVGTAVTLNSIGLLHRRQGDLDLALAYFLESLALRESLKDRTGIASVTNNLGSVYLDRGEMNKALDSFQRVFRLKEELGDRSGMSLALQNIGETHRIGKRPAEALKSLLESFRIAEELSDRITMADSSGSIALVHLKAGEHKLALEYAGRAAELAQQIGAREQHWRARTSQGDAHAGLGERAKAYEAYRDAIATIESLRADVAGGEQERQRFFETKVSPYLSLVSLLVSEGRHAEAFEAAERAKGRVLLEVLAKGPSGARLLTGKAKQEDRDLRATLTELNMKLQEAEKKSGNEPTPAVAGLKSEIERARRDYALFESRLFANHPELRIKRGETATATVAEVSSLLVDGKSAIVEYVVTEEQTLIFVLKRNAGGKVTVSTRTVPIARSSLLHRAERFRRELSERDLGFRSSSRELYKTLFAPIEAELTHVSSLIVIPDDALWHIAFQALEKPGGRFMLEEMEIVIAPSVSVLREIQKRHGERTRNHTAARTLLALGNPALSEDGKGDLPNAEKEANALRDLYGSASSKAHVGRAANESTFKGEAPSYKLLHLATHGVFDDASPMHSHLVLSRSSADRKEDGRLEAWELMEMKLPADLVVLSACETARGRFGAGEGLIGLTWGLFVAGTPSAVVSHWKVDSESTTALMLGFHSRIRPQIRRGARIDAAAALRESALELFRTNPKYRHPYYWAGFSVIGAGL